MKRLTCARVIGNPVYLVLDDLPSGLEGRYYGERCVG